MKYIIKSLKAEYTGGGITVYYGELTDGHYFNATDGDWWAIVLDAMDDNRDNEEYGDAPLFYADWQEEHLVESIAEGQDNFEFFLQIFEFIKKNYKDETKYDGWLNDRDADDKISYMLKNKNGLFFWEESEKEEQAKAKIAELDDLSAAVHECIFDEDGRPTEDTWDMRFTIGFLSPADGVYKNVEMYICPETIEMLENAIEDLKNLVPDYYN